MNEEQDLSDQAKEAGADRAEVHPLSDLQALTEHQASLLAARWVDSVESLVGMVASASSRESACRLLEITDGQMQQILDQARDLLGADVFEKNSTPIQGGPTGVVLTEEEKKRRAP